MRQLCWQRFRPLPCPTVWVVVAEPVPVEEGPELALGLELEELVAAESVPEALEPVLEAMVVPVLVALPADRELEAPEPVVPVVVLALEAMAVLGPEWVAMVAWVAVLVLVPAVMVEWVDPAVLDRVDPVLALVLAV